MIPAPDQIIACTTEKIPDLYYGVGIEQAKKYVREMYQNPEFSDGVTRPTQRTTLVNIDRFEEFLKWKDANKFK